jgi:hypothetical protein
VGVVGCFAAAGQLVVVCTTAVADLEFDLAAIPVLVGELRARSAHLVLVVLVAAVRHLLGFGAAAPDPEFVVAAFAAVVAAVLLLLLRVQHSLLFLLLQFQLLLLLLLLLLQLLLLVLVLVLVLGAQADKLARRRRANGDMPLVAGAPVAHTNGQRVLLQGPMSTISCPHRGAASLQNHKGALILCSQTTSTRLTWPPLRVYREAGRSRSRSRRL